MPELYDRRVDDQGPGPMPQKLTLWQRMALRQIRKQAGKPGSEPLSEDDWAAVMSMHYTGMGRVVGRLFASLPSSPRCSMCGAPFAGPGRHVVGPLGYRPSRKNPNLCITCVEASPPGGITVETGVLFADLRGFTAHSEGSTPRQVSELLRRFYECAEGVFFPDAIIDKLIGDEVMALYLPYLRPDITDDELKRLMFGHAEELLAAVGYGSAQGPFVELGIGLDFGEAFVGNIGERALYDFTAVGDVVNTAARLQGEAGGGEVVLSARVATGLADPEPGEAVSLRLKGKTEPIAAYRVTPGAGPAARGRR
ncbi:MAG TPA: adenylate/guanylate cyclase domain-containing protein [Solirubrobacterales bacterium]|nr:adenylate/guanylate cyclase domain-containing protein [Solirubrobacterales bacterium]